MQDLKVNEYRDVLVIDGAFPERLCDKLIEETIKHPNKWISSEKTGIWQRGEEIFEHAPEEKIKHTWLMQFPELDHETVGHVHNICIAYNRYYTNEGGVAVITQDSGYEIIHYPPRSQTKPHSDHPYPINNQCRIATLIVFLKDVAQGGDLYFPRQQKTVQPKKGRAVLYPPGNTHLHGVTPPSEDRFVLVSFLSCTGPLGNREGI